jgi:hypothetical protein
MVTRRINGLLFEVFSPSHYVLCGEWECHGVETEWHLAFFKDNNGPGSWDLLGYQGDQCTYIEWGKATKEEAVAVMEIEIKRGVGNDTCA